jgi:hypothetical protein
MACKKVYELRRKRDAKPPKRKQAGKPAVPPPPEVNPVVGT